MNPWLILWLFLHCLYSFLSCHYKSWFCQEILRINKKNHHELIYQLCTFYVQVQIQYMHVCSFSATRIKITEAKLESSSGKKGSNSSSKCYISLMTMRLTNWMNIMNNATPDLQLSTNLTTWFVKILFFKKIYCATPFWWNHSVEGDKIFRLILKFL